MAFFQQDLAAACEEAVFEMDGIIRVFERFQARHTSLLSRQEHDLLNSLTDNFEAARENLHKLHVFAKYADEMGDKR